MQGSEREEGREVTKTTVKGHGHTGEGANVILAQGDGGTEMRSVS